MATINCVGVKLVVSALFKVTLDLGSWLECTQVQLYTLEATKCERG